METKKCSKCLHNEMCKYKDVMDEIKLQYSFIDDISCNKFLGASSVEKTEKPEKTEKTSQAKTKSPVVDAPEAPNSNENDSKVKEPVKPKKSRSRGKYEEKTAKTESTEKPSGKTTNMDIDDIAVSALYLSEDIVKVFTENGINTVHDIYAFDDDSSKKWSNLNGFSKKDYDNLSGMLTAINKPALKKGYK